MRSIREWREARDAEHDRVVLRSCSVDTRTVAYELGRRSGMVDLIPPDDTTKRIGMGELVSPQVKSTGLMFYTRPDFLSLHTYLDDTLRQRDSKYRIKHLPLFAWETVTTVRIAGQEQVTSTTVEAGTYRAPLHVMSGKTSAQSETTVDAYTTVEVECDDGPDFYLHLRASPSKVRAALAREITTVRRRVS